MEKKIKLLEEEINLNTSVIKTQTHPVVKRIEKFFDKDQQKDFILVLQNKNNYLDYCIGIKQDFETKSQYLVRLL